MSQSSVKKTTKFNSYTPVANQGTKLNNFMGSAPLTDLNRNKRDTGRSESDSNDNYEDDAFESLSKS